ncbi:MAG: hypothetical protein JST01_14470 [Cyanobacteria bacterium SZAS TMP-1]|nr:hypothetical protein [Cyanobacteria bacterium SZAS TMP-1]
MTVSTTHVKNSYVGDGSQTSFGMTFQMLKPEWLAVEVNGSAIITGFTVSMNPDQKLAPGGTLVFSIAPSLGADVEITRSTPITQPAEFTSEQKINTLNLEFYLDKLTMIAQESAASTQGPAGPTGPQGPKGDAGSLTGPVSSTNGAIAVFNGTGGNLVKNGPAPANNGDTIKVVGGVWTAVSAAGTFPSGSIILWDTNMAAIPAGWAAMDGSNVVINGVTKTTVDTRGKYVLAAAVSDSGSSGYTGSTVRPGTTAGVKTHQHAQGGTVTVNGASATGTISSTAQGSSSGVLTNMRYGTASFNPTPHAHSATIAGNTQSSAEDQRPIETALLLVIKVDE